MKPLLCWIDNFFENKVLLAHHPALQAMLNDRCLELCFFPRKQTSLSQAQWAAVSCHSSNKVQEPLHSSGHSPARGGTCSWTWARSHKPVQHTSELYSGFSFQEFRGTVVLGTYQEKKSFRPQLLTELQFTH